MADPGEPARVAAGVDWPARWDACWRAVGVEPPPPGACEAVLGRWDEPHRHYHDRRHLAECLLRFDAVRAAAVHPAEVELALWYHDAVLDPRAADNEARSAELAAADMAAAGVPPDAIARIRAAILATRHVVDPPAGDAALTVDIDLGILAAPPERFDAYERDVRAEYAWVPSMIFRHKRRGILKAFLDRPRIYTSGAFDADEPRARANLARSVARL